MGEGPKVTPQGFPEIAAPFCVDNKPGVMGCSLQLFDGQYGTLNIMDVPLLFPDHYRHSAGVSVIIRKGRVASELETQNARTNPLYLPGEGLR